MLPAVGFSHFMCDLAHIPPIPLQFTLTDTSSLVSYMRDASNSEKRMIFLDKVIQSSPLLKNRKSRNNNLLGRRKRCMFYD